MKRCALTLLGLLLVSAPAFAASDPLDGTWVINDAKSSWSDGKFPPHMSLTIRVRLDGNTLVYDSLNDTNKAKPMKAHFDAPVDGKPHPFNESERFNQVQVRRTAPNQYEVLEMKDGDVIVGAWWWVSPDGKQLVRRGIGKAADGRSKEYEEYFDKQ